MGEEPETYRIPRRQPKASREASATGRPCRGRVSTHESPDVRYVKRQHQGECVWNSETRQETLGTQDGEGIETAFGDGARGGQQEACPRPIRGRERRATKGALTSVVQGGPAWQPTDVVAPLQDAAASLTGPIAGKAGQGHTNLKTLRTFGISVIVLQSRGGTASEEQGTMPEVVLQ